MIWSSTQGIVDLSSAEAEVYAIVQAGREGLGAWHLLHDLGLERALVEARASAACSAIACKGAGAVKRIAIRSMCSYHPSQPGTSFLERLPVMGIWRTR